MKSRRSKATDIPQKVKERVWERDGHRCIFCNSTQAMPNAHYISRAKGGLGIEQNIVTACMGCHFAMDNTTQRPEFLDLAKAWLMSKYPDWDETSLTYNKYHND